MEEEGLSQRDAVDGVVQIVTLVKLHLDREMGQKSSESFNKTTEMYVNYKVEEKKDCNAEII